MQMQISSGQRAKIENNDHGTVLKAFKGFKADNPEKYWDQYFYIRNADIKEAVIQFMMYYDSPRTAPRKAIEWLEKSVAQKFVPAIYILAQHNYNYQEGGVAKPADFEEQYFQKFLELANKGWPPAMMEVAKRYEAGLGTEKNLATARYLYREAADYGMPEGWWMLGLHAFNGLTEDMDGADYNLAFMSFAKAKEAGYQPAINLLDTLKYPK